VDEDGGQPVVQEAGVDDPPAVGRPGGRLVVAAIVDLVGVHPDRRRGFLAQVHVPDVQPLVGEEDLLAVGRPDGIVEE